MTPMVPLMMFGWIPLSLWFFTKMQPRHAVIAVFALGWMFLPQHNYGLPGLPDYSRITAIGYMILLGTWLFNRQAIDNFRLSALDVPMLVWCLIPIVTSIDNDLGAYDGISASLNRTAMWGLPYFIGRMYFNDREALAELAFGVFLAGLIYVPFCLFEVVMSPRLHKIVYGWHPHDFGQAIRGGGYRPVVFMEHGLMVSMWIVMAFLSGYQLLRSGWLDAKLPKYRKLWKPLLMVLFVTMILSKSTGALVLAIVAMIFLKLMFAIRSSLPLLILISLPLLYAGARGGGYWDGQNLIRAASSVASEERAGSLYFRMRNEDILLDKAKQRFWLGWGLHGRAFVYDETGKAASVPDGMWILAFGEYGVIGLTALGVLLLLPATLFLARYPPRRWRTPAVGAIVSQPFLIVLFTIDSLFNAMFNPLVLIVAGGINSTWLNWKAARMEQREDSGKASTGASAGTGASASGSGSRSGSASASGVYPPPTCPTRLL